MAVLTGFEHAVVALLVGFALPGTTQAQAIDEYRVKAAYIYNFAKFVDWPSGTFASPKDPVQFCILGQNPFGHDLEQALSGKSLDERPLVLKQLSDAKQAGVCQVLFISSSEKKNLRATLGLLGAHSVLTVGETDDFASSGGVVRFVLDGSKVRLEFNLDAAESARLQISSKLLSLGTVLRRNGR